MKEVYSKVTFGYDFRDENNKNKNNIYLYFQVPFVLKKNKNSFLKFHKKKKEK